MDFVTDTPVQCFLRADTPPSLTLCLKIIYRYAKLKLGAVCLLALWKQKPFLAFWIAHGSSHNLSCFGCNVPLSGW